MKEYMEKEMLCLAETLTQEMHYLHQRMKQKLLY